MKNKAFFNDHLSEENENKYDDLLNLSKIDFIKTKKLKFKDLNKDKLSENDCLYLYYNFYYDIWTEYDICINLIDDIIYNIFMIISEFIIYEESSLFPIIFKIETIITELYEYENIYNYFIDKDDIIYLFNKNYKIFFGNTNKISLNKNIYDNKLSIIKDSVNNIKVNDFLNMIKIKNYMIKTLEKIGYNNNSFIINYIRRF